MKRVVYILTAVLAAVTAVLLVAASDFSVVDADMMLETVVNFCLIVGVLVALAVLAVVQLFKPTPRLLLLFAGIAAMLSLPTVLGGGLEGLLLLAAGLLPAIYLLACHGRAVKAQPVQPVKSGPLVVAGVLACLCAAYKIVNMIATTVAFAAYNVSFMTALTPNIGLLICLIALGVFCFLKRRRTSVLYRMLFAGLLAFNMLFLPFGVSAKLNVGFPLEYIVSDVLVTVMQLLAVLFVLVHAAKHRREDFTPPEPEPSEPNAAIAA